MFLRLLLHCLYDMCRRIVIILLCDARVQCARLPHVVDYVAQCLRQTATCDRAEHLGGPAVPGNLLRCAHSFCCSLRCDCGLFQGFDRSALASECLVQVLSRAEGRLGLWRWPDKGSMDIGSTECASTSNTLHTLCSGYPVSWFDKVCTDQRNITADLACLLIVWRDVMGSSSSAGRRTLPVSGVALSCSSMPRCARTTSRVALA